MANETSSGSDFDLGVFLDRYRKPLIGGVVAVAVVGGGFWFWSASQKLKTERGDQAYRTAERAYYSGNPQQAEAELARAVQRYGNTTGGVRAAMLLARTLYQQEKPAEGIAQLREAAGRGASKPFRAAIHAMIGAGFEDAAQFDSAAAAYGLAVEEARTTIDREIYLADQARALGSAGKKAEALALWEQIAARDASPLLAEARLRIGELSAAPARAN
jgi:predicted negative regulator of RcsB-dependent stress response